MNVAYINPFLVAAQEICGGSFKVSMTAGKPRLLEADERLWKFYQLSALIQLSDGVKGMAAVSFSERVALALASGLAGEPFLDISDDCKDALGEVANLIVGSAKRNLPGGLVSMSPPTLTNTSALIFSAKQPTILVPFDATMGRLAVHVTFESPIRNAKSPIPALSKSAA